MYNERVSTEPASHDQPHDAAADRRLHLALLAATLVVRSGVLLLAADFSGRDADAYRQLARQLWSSGQYALAGQPTALRPPLYPMLLAPTEALGRYANLGVGIVHVALGVATVALTLTAGRSLGLRRGAVVAALMVLFDPILLHQSRLVMSETAAAACGALGMCSLAVYWRRRGWRWAAISGASLGLGAVCRPEFFPWALAVPGVIAISNSGYSTRRRALRDAAIVLVVAALPVAAWTIRNAAVLGRPILLTSHGGYTLLLANNELFYDYLNTGDGRLPWDSALFDRQLEQLKLDERPTNGAWDDWCYETVWTGIRARPRDFLRAAVYRVKRFWSALPYPRSLEESSKERGLRWAIAVWYLGMYVAVVVGLWKLAVRAISPPWVFGLLLVLCFAGIHSLYWSDMRMRAAIIPALAIWAGASADHPSERRRRA